MLETHIFQRQYGQYRIGLCGLFVVCVVAGITPVTAHAQAHCQRVWVGKSDVQVDRFRSQMKAQGVYDPSTNTYSTEAIGTAVLQHVAKYCPRQLAAMDDGSDTWLVRYAMKTMQVNLASGQVALHNRIPGTAFEAMMGGPGFDLGLDQKDATPEKAQRQAGQKTGATRKRIAPEPLPIGELTLLPEGVELPEVRFEFDKQEATFDRPGTNTLPVGKLKIIE